MMGLCWPCLQSHFVKTLGSFHFVKAHEVHHCPLRILVETLLFTLLSHEDSWAQDGKCPSFFPTKWRAQMRNPLGNEHLYTNYFWVGRPPSMVDAPSFTSLGMPTSWTELMDQIGLWFWLKMQYENRISHHKQTYIERWKCLGVGKKCAERKNVRMKFWDLFLYVIYHGNMMTQH